MRAGFIASITQQRAYFYFQVRSIARCSAKTFDVFPKTCSLVVGKTARSGTTTTTQSQIHLPSLNLGLEVVVVDKRKKKPTTRSLQISFPAPKRLTLEVAVTKGYATTMRARK